MASRNGGRLRENHAVCSFSVYNVVMCLKYYDDLFHFLIQSILKIKL